MEARNTNEIEQPARDSIAWNKDFEAVAKALHRGWTPVLVHQLIDIADTHADQRVHTAHDALVADNNALRDQVQQLQRDMEGLLAAGKVLAEDIAHKQAVQDQLVAALKAAKARLGFANKHIDCEEEIAMIDQALAAAGAA